MLIRPLEFTDVPAIAQLLRVSALAFILPESNPEAQALFLRENDAAGLHGFLAAGHVYHVAIDAGALAGFIALRDNCHIFHLFIDQGWQRQGLARRLWLVAQAAAHARSGATVFTVNASNYAVPVYQRFGFVRSAPQQCLRGIYFNPMRLDPPD